MLFPMINHIFIVIIPPVPVARDCNRASAGSGCGVSDQLLVIQQVSLGLDGVRKVLFSL